MSLCTTGVLQGQWDITNQIWTVDPLEVGCLVVCSLDSELTPLVRYISVSCPYFILE